jgi:hypothetical protein
MPLEKVKVNQEGLKLSGAHQHVVCADDVNLLHENMSTTKKSTDILLITCRRLVYKKTMRK